VNFGGRFSRKLRPDSFESCGAMRDEIRPRRSLSSACSSVTLRLRWIVCFAERIAIGGQNAI